MPRRKTIRDLITGMCKGETHCWISASDEESPDDWCCCGQRQRKSMEENVPKKKPIKVDAETGEVLDDPTLPGFECADNPAIEKAARRFAIKKQEAKDSKDAADIAHEALLAVLHEHDVKHYRKHGIEVILDSKERAIVQIVA